MTGLVYCYTCQSMVQLRGDGSSVLLLEFEGLVQVAASSASADVADLPVPHRGLMMT